MIHRQVCKLINNIKPIFISAIEGRGCIFLHPLTTLVCAINTLQSISFVKSINLLSLLIILFPPLQLSTAIDTLTQFQSLMMTNTLITLHETHICKLSIAWNPTQMCKLTKSFPKTIWFIVLVKIKSWEYFFKYHVYNFNYRKS